MLRKTRSWGSLLLALALAPGGCGGNVIVDKNAGFGGSGGSVAPAGGGGSGGGAGGLGGEAGANPAGGGSSVGAVACTGFCAEAAKQGCPKFDDCQGWCESLFQPGCEDELAAALDCIPGVLLTDTCHIAYPPDETQCTDKLELFSQCAFLSQADTCSSAEASLDAAGGCQGEIQCTTGDQQMSCNADGACQCFENGQFVGSCQNIIAGVELCFPVIGCCAPLVGP